MTGIICAMQIEADGIIALSQNTQTEEIAGMKFTTGTLNGKDIAVVVCGVGKVNAAVCAATVCDKFGADCIVNVGIAGAMAHGLHILDVVISSETGFHDQDEVMLKYYPQRAFFPADEALAALLREEPERFIQFPTRYEIHEYSIMDSFVDYLPPGKIKSELSSAIRGKGAFRRFKQTIRFHGIEQLWYDYQANAYRELAERWCNENDIQFE